MGGLGGKLGVLMRNLRTIKVVYWVNVSASSAAAHVDCANKPLYLYPVERKIARRLKLPTVKIVTFYIFALVASLAMISFSLSVPVS